tara:strand:+ start:283 stop:441 length:159 start_codon:yes stop_codon:yes gene_type:complete
MNYKWLTTLVIQVLSGIVLYFWGDEAGKSLGLVLLGGSFGQGITAQIKAKET